MVIEVNVKVLADILLYSLGLTVLIFLILCFFKLYKILKKLDKILGKHENNIDTSLGLLPQVIGNINDVSLGVKTGVDKAGAALEELEDSLIETVTTVSDTTEGFLDFVSIAGEVFKSVLKVFSSGKK